MVSILNSAKKTDLSVVASRSLSVSVLGTGLSGVSVARMAGVSFVSLLPVIERNERPTQAPAAAVATAQVSAYSFAAAGAEDRTKQHQHHTMWAFRGLEPWSDPV